MVTSRELVPNNRTTVHYGGPFQTVGNFNIRILEHDLKYCLEHVKP